MGGRYSILDENDQIGFIDESGNITVQPKFEAVKIGYHRDLAPVKFNSQWGYICLDGNWVIEPQFALAFPFDNADTALVRLTPHGLLGRIDRSGALVISNRYEELGDFSEGLAFAIRDDGRRGRLHGYISKDEKFQIILQNGRSGSLFRDGVANVWLDGANVGVISRSGRWLWPKK